MLYLERRKFGLSLRGPVVAFRAMPDATEGLRYRFVALIKERNCYRSR